MDQQLAHIDFELKRNGIVEPIPLGLELPGGLLIEEELARLKAPTALERARAVRDAVRRVRSAGTDLPGTGTAFRQLVHGHGYLLSRTSGAEGMTAPTGFVVGGNLGAEDDSAAVLARLLEGAWQRGAVSRCGGGGATARSGAALRGAGAAGVVRGGRPRGRNRRAGAGGSGVLLRNGGLRDARMAREGAAARDGRGARARGGADAHEDADGRAGRGRSRVTVVEGEERGRGGRSRW